MKQIDWKSLGFKYLETNCHIRYEWRDGAWDGGELVDSPPSTSLLRHRASIMDRRHLRV